MGDEADWRLLDDSSRELPFIHHAAGASAKPRAIFGKATAAMASSSATSSVSRHSAATALT